MQNDPLLNTRGAGSAITMASVNHMSGTSAIAEIFGVNRKTVIQWIKDGAPIHLVGKKNQANYSELWDWLKNQA